MSAANDFGLVDFFHGSTTKWRVRVDDDLVMLYHEDFPEIVMANFSVECEVLDIEVMRLGASDTPKHKRFEFAMTEVLDELRA